MGRFEKASVGTSHYLLRFCVPGVGALLSAYLCAKTFHCAQDLRGKTYAGRASGLVPLLYAIVRLLIDLLSETRFIVGVRRDRERRSTEMFIYVDEAEFPWRACGG